MVPEPQRELGERVGRVAVPGGRRRRSTRRCRGSPSRAPGSRRRRRRSGRSPTSAWCPCGACRRPRRRRPPGSAADRRGASRRPAPGRSPASAMCLPKAVTAVRMVRTSISERCQSSATRRRPKASRSSDSRTRLSGFGSASCATRITPVCPVGCGSTSRSVSVRSMKGSRTSRSRRMLNVLGRHVLAPERGKLVRPDPARLEAQPEVQAGLLAHEELGRGVEFPLAHQDPQHAFGDQEVRVVGEAAPDPAASGCRSPRAPGW